MFSCCLSICVTFFIFKFQVIAGLEGYPQDGHVPAAWVHMLLLDTDRLDLHVDLS